MEMKTASDMFRESHISRSHVFVLFRAGLHAVTVAPLANYDAIIFGTPTRFGNMSGQMRTFLDQTGPLYSRSLPLAL